MKTLLHVINESKQRKVICNDFRLIPLDEMQTVSSPVAIPLQSALPVPKSRQVCQLPPGGSQVGCCEFAQGFVKPQLPTANPSVRPFGLPAPPLGSQGPRCPLWGKCREAAKGVSLVTLSCCHSSYHTPSVRPFGLPAPPLGSRDGCCGFAQVFIRT